MMSEKKFGSIRQKRETAGKGGTLSTGKNTASPVQLKRPVGGNWNASA